jgi:hypothetical protein
MNKLEAVNAVMRRLGKPVVAALDTNGTSTPAYMERQLDDAIRQIQQRGWHWNAKYDVEATADGSGQIDVSALEGVAEVFHVDTYGEDARTDVIRQGDYLYDRVEKSTTSFSGTIKLQYVYDVTWDQVPPAFQDWAVGQAALNFNRFYGGDRSRDAVLDMDLRDSRSRAIQDETRISDINILDTEEMRQVRGRPRMRNRSVY